MAGAFPNYDAVAAPEPALVWPTSFPASRDEVTASWVRETLQPHPHFQGDPIRDVDLHDLGDGLGQLSSLTLAELTCGSGRRKQLVIKLHASVPEMHQVALAYGHYQSEVHFYAEMAPSVPMRTPDIYISAMDPACGRVVIVMEGFGTWHSPDQIVGASAEEVTIAVSALSGLAATYWNNPPIRAFPWLRSPDSPAYASLPQDYAACVPILLDRFERDWPGGSARPLKQIAGSYARIQQALLRRPQVVAHWDYRVENLFYGADGELAVIDWQLMRTDVPANDLAYLLACNVSAGLRRDIEADMMARYLAGLRERGVLDYQLTDLELDYRLALLSISAILVIGGANADIGNARSQQLFLTIGARLLAAIDDWQATDLIAGL